jgi:hypothetical protein
MVCLRNICVNTLHKGDSINNNNNNNNRIVELKIAHIPHVYPSNPLPPELNPSPQRCLPGFFTGDFNF